MPQLDLILDRYRSIVDLLRQKDDETAELQFEELEKGSRAPELDVLHFMIDDFFGDLAEITPEDIEEELGRVVADRRAHG